ncbi:MAG: hypothetical protein GF307_07975 [candidate division Zixibacteria bacterium]|nr:hypothetical protein [candidate division Zixibacteria bacterium]
MGILGSGIAAALLVIITQLFIYEELTFFPILFVYWGILLAAMGLGNDALRLKRAITVILILQGLILILLGGLRFFQTDYHTYYLYRALVGFGVLLLLIIGYQIGGKKS